jgi:hypothetical protein
VDPSVCWVCIGAGREEGDVFVLRASGYGSDGAEDDAWISPEECLRSFVVAARRRQGPFNLVVLLGNRERVGVKLVLGLRSLPEDVRERLEEVHFVHPGWLARFLGMGLWQLSFLPSQRANDLYDRYFLHERTEFLTDTTKDVSSLRLPREVTKHDELLDVQARENDDETRRVLAQVGHTVPAPGKFTH